ncbi:MULTISPECIES: IS256 family transposase [Thermaerobacter]|uniref:Mutator family transposase n=1 Tax=Thermaerobacter composti TaxID=554949 RepID=A0ABZ0QMC8_9FIRM|nr:MULTISPECIES: IS256 family transposase [Thermaerobacter]PZN00837.1 MAG: IS256 family transposase [Bacillota bacterium]QBS36555.1 IS256 family transposase [Thermaerobacter sp. FW80]QBS36629.1 IS256 family transposase [Thermaerobacter sp. FW80]QBS36672.1 IS256 family transposase [Thermaerobacter sp. FW80]QBS36729.1 IS256 family transposase [Thermaerobacter sp. FW80]
MTADFRMALLELLRQYQGEPEVDALREGLRWLAQQLMEVEVSELIGAQRYERTPSRTTYRNGYRPRRWDTRVGTIELQIPKLRRGSYFPSLLKPRRRAERALLAVVQEAYVHGVSTRKVDELVQALGVGGLSKSEVSRICAELDEHMERFRNRPLEGEYPYVWLDAKAVKVRQDGRVVNMAAVIAVGVRETGEREVLGFDVGAAETYEFWLDFLRRLVARGLKGVRLVISDAHEGLKRAIGEVLAGATWQRCRVHFMRNLLARVPKHAQSMVAALVRTIFAQPDRASARQQLEQVAANLERRFPQVASLLREAAEEVLAYMDFPPEHWRGIHSTNVLERLNRELARRCDVVGIFPNVAAVLRLLGALLEEQQDEWLVQRRYFSQASMAKLKGGDALGSDSVSALAVAAR